MLAEQEQVIDVVADEFDVPSHKLHSRTELGAELGLDSIDRLGLAVCLEDRFGIEIEDTSIDRAKTVGDVIDLITQQQS